MADPNNPWGQTTDDPWTGDEGTVAWSDSKQQQSQSTDEWGQPPAGSDWGEPDQPDQAKQASQDAAWGDQPADNPADRWDTPAADAGWDDPADSKQASQQDTPRNPETSGWGQANTDWNTPTGDNQWGNPPASDSNQWNEEDRSQWGETAERTQAAETPDNKPDDKRKHESRKPVDRKKLVGIIIGVLILILVVILCHGRNTGTPANDWQEEWASIAQQAEHMADTADQSNQQARNMITDIKTTANDTPRTLAQYVAQTARLEGDMSVLRSLETQPAQTVGQTQTALTQALTPALTAVQQHAAAPSANPLKQLVSQWAAQTITSSNQSQAQQAITRIQQLTQQVDQNK